jgi:hypothetical protein
MRDDAASARAHSCLENSPTRRLTSLNAAFTRSDLTELGSERRASWVLSREDSLPLSPVTTLSTGETQAATPRGGSTAAMPRPMAASREWRSFVPRQRGQTNMQ